MNRERATALIEAEGLQAVLAVAPENILWWTKYDVFQSVWNRFARAALVPAGAARPFLVLPMPEVAFAADDRIQECADVWGFGAAANLVPAQAGLDLDETTAYVDEVARDRRRPDVVTAVFDALAASGTGAGTIAVDGLAAPSFVHQLNARDSTWNFVAGGEELLRRIRMVKSTDEVDKLRRAAVLNNQAISSALDVTARDGTFAEAAEAHRAVVQGGGGLVQHWSLAAGRHSSTIRRPLSEKAVSGDRGWYESGLILDGYVSDIGGTFQVGVAPSSRERACYEAISAGIDAGIENARLGIRPSEVYQRIMDAVRAAGLPGFTYSMAGHGIGVEPRDYPMIAPASSATSPFIAAGFDPELEPGMVLNFEVPLHEMGIGTFQHEVTCLVTDHEPELLSPPRDYRIL